MLLTLGDLARLVEGELHGDADIQITGADTIRDARPGDITFAESPRLAVKLAASAAAAVITPHGYLADSKPCVTVADVQGAFTKIVLLFRPRFEDQRVGVHATACVSPSARIGANVTIHAHAVIGDNVEIGSDCTIHSGVQIMAGCTVGDGVILFPNVVLYERTLIGPRSIIHAGAVIGAYGFGYTTVEGRHRLSAQLGHVEIGREVEIGACSTVDRGTYGATVIGDGTKIDNQVMIAHNCRIGKHNIICSQVGVAGSTTTGDYVVMAGQVGIRDHVHIGDRATLGAKAGVMNDIPAGGAYVGIPAVPERQQLMIVAATLRLPELKKQMKALQRTVDQLVGVSGPAPQPDET